MFLSELFKYVPNLLPHKIKNETFVNLWIDSRDVFPNDVFIAQKGYHTDSHQFIPDLLKKGAWVIAQQGYSIENIEDNLLSRLIFVPSTNEIIAPLAKAFFNAPDEDLKIIGVTGTNGKTTTTSLLYHAFMQEEIKTGLIGTIHNKIGNLILNTQNTTPNAFELYKLIKQMQQEDCKIIVMEISSHALSLFRVSYLALDIALFTNLTAEHLDFHKDMQEYLASKLKIFELLTKSPKKNKLAIYNTNSQVANSIKIKLEQENIPYQSFSIQNSLDTVTSSNFLADQVKQSIKGTEFNLYQKNKDLGGFKTHLPGIFNIENILGATIALLHCHIPLENIKKYMEQVQVKGRFQDITPDKPYSVIVDYAHSPDALENVLKTAKNLNPNKLIVVFGCGGNRDKTKRPIMGNIAASLADIVIITSDNPRQENPLDIIQDIIADIKDKHNVLMCVNRSQAIKKGLSFLKQGDIMMIAGKGHEEYQIFKYKTIPFSDSQIALEYIKGLF